MAWCITYWHTLGPLISAEHNVKVTAYLSIVDHVPHSMTASGGSIHQDYEPCCKTHLKQGFFVRESEFTVLKRLPQ